MSLYEVVFIVRQDASAQDVQHLIEKITNLVTKQSGKVVSMEYCGLREMAYKIKKNKRGHYYIMTVECSSSLLDDVNNYMKLNESIIRHLSLAIEFHNPESLAPLKQQDEASKSVIFDPKFDVKPSVSGSHNQSKKEPQYSGS